MIDYERLRDMEEDFGAEELALIVAAFLEEATAAVDRLRTGWADAAVRAERLHFLKGCARTIGAVGLGDLCERLEAGNPGPDGFRALEQAFRAVRDVLASERLHEAG